MADVKFEDGVFRIDPPKKPKKITGTRFGAVLEANKWSSPFQAWCEITKAWVKPYESTIYTEAGKVIEDKQLTWFSRLLPIVRPEQIFGKDFFKKTYGDFFPKEDIFGGMWDSLVGTMDDIQGVIECKTTKRSEDWQDDVPEYYALQAALYAYMLHVDDVYMIVTFLEESDYDAPEKFVCNADNTTYVYFKVSERYPDFESYIEYCKTFWQNHVMTGISPEFDEDRDKEYLKGLRTKVVADDNITDLLAEAESLYNRITEVEASINADKKRLSAIEKLIKTYAIEHETNGQTMSVFKANEVQWVVSKSEKMALDEKRLKKDGIYEQYLSPTVSYTIRKSEIKGE